MILISKYGELWISASATDSRRTLGSLRIGGGVVDSGARKV